MSNEEFYDELTSNDFEDAEMDGGRDDYEVELRHRAPKGDVFLQIFQRTRHWLRAAVRPEEIIREDKIENMFSFVKTMKDPSFNPEDGVRYIKFKCNVVLGELEIEMSFTHIALAYQDVDGNVGEFYALEEGAEECPEVKQVFEKVINNLAQYLSKS